MSVTSDGTLIVVIDYLKASKLFPNKKSDELLSMIEKDFTEYEVDVIYGDDTECKKCKDEYQEYCDKCETCKRNYCDDCSQCNVGHRGLYTCDFCNAKIIGDCFEEDCESMWCDKCKMCKSGHYKDKNGKLQKKTELKKTHESEKENHPDEISIVLSTCEGGGYKIDDNEENTDFDIDLKMLTLAKKKYDANFRLKNSLHISW